MKDHCKKTHSLLERYFDQELSGRQLNFVEDHLADCPHCARELVELQELRGLVQGEMREAAKRVDFATFWRSLEPRLTEPRPSFWEQLTVSVREYLSVYKTIWATAAAAAAVAAVVAVPLLVREPAATDPQRPQSNECIIESIESSGSTAMVYEIEQDQTKVIWMFEDPEDPNEGPSSL